MGTNKGVQGLSPVRECVWPGLKLGLGHTGGGGLTKEGVPVEVCCDLCKGRRDNVETQINTMFWPGGAGGRGPVRAGRHKALYPRTLGWQRGPSWGRGMGKQLWRKFLILDCAVNKE